MGFSYVHIPHCDEEVKDLSEEQLMTLITRSLAHFSPKHFDPTQFAIGTACERELERRGRGDLVELAINRETNKMKDLP